MFHQRDMFVHRPRVSCHSIEHMMGIHTLHTAVGMGYDHYLCNTKLIYGHQQRAHGRVKRVGDCAACILYHLDIAATDAGEPPGAVRPGEYPPTCDNGNSLVRIFGCGKSARAILPV